MRIGNNMSPVGHSADHPLAGPERSEHPKGAVRAASGALAANASSNGLFAADSAERDLQRRLALTLPASQWPLIVGASIEQTILELAQASADVAR